MINQNNGKNLKKKEKKKIIIIRKHLLTEGETEQ